MYRGAAPIQHALMDGQQETGVCVIEMTEWKKGIDSGAIWATERMVSRTISRREVKGLFKPCPRAYPITLHFQSYATP